MSNYIHGSDPEEQARLSRLNELINERCMALLNIRQGSRILDIGSGLGQFTLAMAGRSGPAGKCVGIERDLSQMKRAVENLERHHQSGVEFREGNVENLQLRNEEWGTFDLAHGRFILEHVAQPEQVVAGMARAVRPGGRVVLADDDHDLLKLYPPPAGFDAVWKAYERSYELLGNDPFIGRRLVTLLNQGGLINIANNVVFFGDSAGSSTFGAYVRNLIGILEGAKGVILAHSLMDEQLFNESIRHLEEWGRRDDAALWYVINWAEGTKP